ncbi:MAG: hypothetical protein ACP5I4_07630 [Oceanipulchritudo sp.]
MDDSGLPWGYTDVSDFGVDEDPNRLARQNSLVWDHARSLQLSEAPYVDYMVASNAGGVSGTAPAGILAEKQNGPYLDASKSTVFSLLGGSNGGIVPDFENRSNADRYSSGEMPVGAEKFSAFASWTDGFPLPSLTSWWGVSWGGGFPIGSDDYTVEMEVRVDLASDGPVNVAHLFNDGWYYSSDLGGEYSPPGWAYTPHPTLEGHEFTVTHHAADGTVVDEVALVLPSGGGSNILGVANDYAAQFGVAPSSSNVRADGKYYLINSHAQFYTATITATRQAEGDYLILHHRAGNIGYRMTLVTLGDHRPWDSGQAFSLTPGVYNSNPLLGNTYGYSAEWGYSAALGTVYVSLFPDAVYSPDLGWLIAPYGEADSGIFFFRVDTSDWIWTLSGLKGKVYDFASDIWLPGS